MSLEFIDRAFQIEFARFRRKRGDENLQAAWFAANSKITGYLILPFLVAGFLAVFTFYLTTKIGTKYDHRKWEMIITFPTWWICAMLLGRRFKKYLWNPPPLDPKETSADKWVMIRFRLMTTGVFALACLTLFALNELYPGLLPHGM